MGVLSEFEGYRPKDGTAVSFAGGENILLPLSQHGITTLQSLGKMCSGSTLRTSPFCHESPQNQREIQGWVLDTPSSSAASTLPLPYNLFHGITVALCETSESEILSLMQDIESTRTKLSEAVNEIMEPIKREIDSSSGSKNNGDSVRASWSRCKPTDHQGHPSSLQFAMKNKDGDVIFHQDQGKSVPIIDSDEWLPELSPDGYIGFFHHWHHGTRENKLCLYVVCQSYLPKACMEFADMVHRAGDICTAGCVCLSEELQWLRTANTRNRARLIVEVCKKMKIKLPTVLDYNSASSSKNSISALVTTDTLHHDLVLVGGSDNGVVRLLNHCAETKSAFNGSACSMAPWEGVWIFQGLNSTQGCAAQNYTSGVSDFGKPYGDFILPTSAPRILDKSSLCGPNMPLTFVAADPLQCKPLQIWNQERSREAADHHHHYQPSIIVTHKPLPQPQGAGCSFSTEGLDPDVVTAFQKSMALRACPTSYLVPNIPGALPPSMAHNYLIFDEYVLKTMAKFGWSRTQGIVKLSPMACALYEHWKTQGVARYDTN
jgi:hypothetical protein